METFNNLKSRLESKLHEDNCCNKYLQQFEEKTGVNRLYFVSGLVGFLAVYLMIGYGTAFLAAFIGFVYPAYCSIKAIESAEKDDDTKWLTYWVVYAFFSLLEFFTDCLLWWIPVYDFLKCVFFIFLMYPAKFNGSVLIYYNVIRPFVLKHQSQIDSRLDQASGFVKKAGTDLASAAVNSTLSSGEEDIVK